MTREQTIYKRMLAAMEKTRDALDLVDRYAHELLDELDQQRAEKIAEEHRQWLDEDRE